MIYCPNCNKPSTGKKLACPHCGTKLPDAPEPKPAEKPAPAPAPDKAPREPARPNAAEKPPAKREVKREAKRLGEILIAAGMLTEDQLQAALARQKKLGIRLGAILVREKVISESQLVQALSHQADLPWVDLWNIDIPKDLGRLVPLALVQKYRFVPMDVQTGEDGARLLYLAMDNAADRDAIRDAAAASGMGIMPMFAALPAIVASIQTLYAEELAAAVAEAPVAAVVTAPPEKKRRKPGWETLPYVDESVLRQPVARPVEARTAPPDERPAEEPAGAPAAASAGSWDPGPGDPEAEGRPARKRAPRGMALLDGSGIRWADQAKAGFVVDAGEAARLAEIRALAGGAEDAGRLREYLLAVVELLLQKNLLSSEELLNKLKRPKDRPKKGG